MSTSFKKVLMLLPYPNNQLCFSLTNSKEQCPSWEAVSAHVVKEFLPSVEHEGSCTYFIALLLWICLDIRAV